MRNYNNTPNFFHRLGQYPNNVVCFVLTMLCVVGVFVFGVHWVSVNNYAYSMVNAEADNDSVEFVSLCRYATPEQMARYEKVRDELRAMDNEEKANLEFAVRVWNARNK